MQINERRGHALVFALDLWFHPNDTILRQELHGPLWGAEHDGGHLLMPAVDAVSNLFLLMKNGRKFLPDLVFQEVNLISLQRDLGFRSLADHIHPTQVDLLGFDRNGAIECNDLRGGEDVLDTSEAQ